MKTIQLPLPEGDKAPHALLGASSAHRWWACPGSAWAEAVSPKTSSEAAALGTSAHRLAELCLTSDQDAAEYIERTVEGNEVDEDMASAVQVYLDWVRTNCVPGDIVMLEQKFSLAKMASSDVLKRNMFGTADLVRYRPTTKHLLVADYKHGAGVFVEAAGNPQPRYYGLGAMLSLPEDMPVTDITIAIVQPRAKHTGEFIRTEDISAFELMEWAADLLDAAEKAIDPASPKHAGDHCQFCKFADQCEELRRRAKAVARLEFDNIETLPAVVDGDILETEPVPPEPHTLTPDQISKVLGQTEVVKLWIKAVERYALASLQAGDKIPGWKLVETMGHRKWKNPDEAMLELMSSGLSDDQLFTKKLKTLPQVEAAIGKKEFAKTYKELGTREVSGVTIAPDYDNRQAVAGNGAGDFDKLEE